MSKKNYLFARSPATGERREWVYRYFIEPQNGLTEKGIRAHLYGNWDGFEEPTHSKSEGKFEWDEEADHQALPVSPTLLPLRGM